MEHFTTQDLKRQFDIFRAKYFPDMPNIELKASGRKTKRQCGHFEFKVSRLTKKFSLKIVIHRLESPQGGWKHTLLHEMVHYSLYLKYCAGYAKSYSEDPNGMTARLFKRSVPLCNHTGEFNAILRKYDAMEKSNKVIVPEPVKVPVKAITAPNTAIGQMIDTFCGMGQIIGVTNTYYTVKLASGNIAKVRVPA